jgi:putative ATPase
LNGITVGYFVFHPIRSVDRLAPQVAMTENLFSQQPPANASSTASSPDATTMPLATRMRPRALEDFVGQRHILADGKLLWRAIQADRLSSIILYGPPGTGKTSLAQVIANVTRSRFERLSGVESNVADIRRVISTAANRLANTGQKTILFIDEIHRFNKAQQDVLLPDVENGTVRLIGATTHNPFFYVNSPLVSRSQIFELKPLTPDDVIDDRRRSRPERRAHNSCDACDRRGIHPEESGGVRRR